jgi:DNA-binding CsgD family transcriptional regulator/anti-sigma regulatory factor (Ser/Thr protein kinase)
LGAVEWALNARSAASVAALRREVVAHLRRHGEHDSDFDRAEVVVAELLANALEHAPGPVWVRTSWSRERPRIEVHDLGEGFPLDPALPEPPAERGRGLFLADAIAEDLAREGGPRRDSRLVATLPVRRRKEPPRETRGAPGANAGGRSAPKESLTRREREVVTLIAESLTGKEIAQKLMISEKTVERHRGNILLKLGLRDRVALTRWAIRRGLIEP